MGSLDPITAVEKAQAAFERNALSLSAALFAVAFFMLLAWHLRQSNKWLRDEAERSKGLILAVEHNTKLFDVLQKIAFEAERKGNARRGGTNPGFRPADLKGE